ncbi:MAG: hypothetical protein ISS93_01145 [Candidatus Aenigmarchaeota archaeon]|nr:hypothetical protein [Candidatus Aenigmarchaeota archaeon]
MAKCIVCGKEAKKPIFKKGVFFCSRACEKKAGDLKIRCKGNVCTLKG